jgi:hypothetical protein
MPEYEAPEYAVLVGNVGTVYRGPDMNQARMAYDHYLSLAKHGEGSAGHESVSLFSEHDVIEEWSGILCFTARVSHDVDGLEIMVLDRDTDDELFVLKDGEFYSAQYGDKCDPSEEVRLFVLDHIPVVIAELQQTMLTLTSKPPQEAPNEARAH